MIFTPLAIAGALQIDIEPHSDSRGLFARFFCAATFERHGLVHTWTQCNVSLSRTQGTVRGLHFQRAPSAETKLVKCVSGAAFDVMVDLRMNSPTFGSWVSIELTAENRRMAYVPEGFAHGIQSLLPNTELIYFHSAPHDPACEGGLHHADRRIGIEWPLPISVVSERDRDLLTLDQIEPLA